MQAFLVVYDSEQTSFLVSAARIGSCSALFILKYLRLFQ